MILGGPGVPFSPFLVQDPFIQSYEPKERVPFIVAWLLGYQEPQP